MRHRQGVHIVTVKVDAGRVVKPAVVTARSPQCPVTRTTATTRYGQVRRGRCGLSARCLIDLGKP